MNRAHGGAILLPALFLAWLAPLFTARAEAPPASATRCSKADHAKTRKHFQDLYGAGEYTKAVETLRRAKEDCWEVLDATARGWLVSDLGLATLRAGQPGDCLQILAEAPKELEPQSRVARAIAFNRGLCAKEPSQDIPVATQGTSLPVQVMPGLQVSSQKEAAAALTREWRAPYELREGRLPARQARELRRCTDLDGVDVKDVDVTVTHEFHAFQMKAIQCRALRRVAQAQPSRISHVREVLTMKMPGEVLPAALAAVISDEDAERLALAQRAGRSWHDVDKELRFSVAPNVAQGRELEVHGEDVEGSLEWWATGDFNADGYEDVLVFRSLSPTGGSLADLAAFVLTRTRPKGVLEVLERLH
ncbi:hypothetical protein JQX13_18210 [Archangium violaceum]|uniref:hypothetical protein n=1 Tax=Archangium violaceum TaxID=83451 RepID=UPI00193B3FAE|nr:hypothetical protein [Archangium violaceum]QRK11819.1 hypothetical protein JQX13_18210 [Archangium violaceum]